MAIKIVLHAPNSVGGGTQRGVYFADELNGGWGVENTITLYDDGTYTIDDEEIGE